MESRQQLHRLDEERVQHDKRSLAFIIFSVIGLVFIIATFMNPVFMKHHVAQGNSSVVVEQSVNRKFDRFARVIGAASAGDQNMLTSKQTQPLADAMLDYELGLHWFKADPTDLAQQVEGILKSKIDDNASTEAKAVKQALKKRAANAIYAIEVGFNLSGAVLAANLETLFLVIDLVLLFLCIVAATSIRQELRANFSGRARWHLLTAAAMWAGFWLMAIFVLLAALPMLLDLSNLSLLGYLLEIASGVFLELVIVGAVLFVAAAIPWQLTGDN